MQTRTRNAIVLAAAGAVVTAGLVAVARHRQPASLPAGALDAVPSGALLVATADLVALRASPAGAPFLREGREIPGLGKVRDVCGFDPVDTLTEAAVAIPAAGDAGEFGLVAAGPVDDEALLRCASKVIEARGGRPVITTIGSFRSVHDATLATTGGEIAVRRGGPLLLGAGSYLRAMIDAADGRAPSIRSSVAHSFLGHEVGDAAVRVTVVLSPELRRTLAEELQSGGAAGSPGNSIVAGALGVRLGADVGLHAILSCDSADACSKLAVSFKEARDARASELGVRAMGFGAVLERITIQPEGELLHARVEIPAGEAATLADRLLKLRGLRHPMPGPEPAEQGAPGNGAAPPVRPDEVLAPGAKKGDADAGAPAKKDARDGGTVTR